MKQIIVSLFILCSLLFASSDTTYLSTGVKIVGTVKNFEKLLAGDSDRARIISTDKMLHIYPVTQVKTIIHDGQSYKMGQTKLEPFTRTVAEKAASTFQIIPTETEFQQNQFQSAPRDLFLRELSRDDLQKGFKTEYASDMYEGQYFQIMQKSNSGKSVPLANCNWWGVKNDGVLYRTVGGYVTPLKELDSSCWYSIPMINHDLIAKKRMEYSAVAVTSGLIGVMTYASIMEKYNLKNREELFIEEIMCITEGAMEHPLTLTELEQLLVNYPDLYSAYRKLDLENREKSSTNFFFRYIRRKNGENHREEISAKPVDLGLE